MRIGRKFLMRLTEKDFEWLYAYLRSNENSSAASRAVLGGTAISVRVKGHKKKVKLKPILDEIYKIWEDGFLKKGVDEIECEVDTYLKRLKRRTRKSL